MGAGDSSLALGMNKYAIKDKPVMGQRDSSLALGMTRLP
jgi:hypothetical protein